MKNPEQQSELSKLRDEYQDSISTLIDEGWIRLGGSIEAYVEALEAKAISAAELVEKARAWIACKDEMPKIGDDIILYYPLGNGNHTLSKRYSWCGGVVDGSDDGLFVDYEVDGQEIKTDCYWFKLPEPPK